MNALFSTEGRAGRLEFLLCRLFVGAVGIAAARLLAILIPAGKPQAFYPALGVVVLAMFWSFVAVSIKRCRDLGRSPWCLLLELVPVANCLLELYLLLAPGSELAEG